MYTCKTCGGPLIGDGYTTARHCEDVDPDGYEPDAGPIHCTSTREQLRRALRAYDIAGPLAKARRHALGDVLKPARQLTEE